MYFFSFMPIRRSPIYRFPEGWIAPVTTIHSCWLHNDRVNNHILRPWSPWVPTLRIGRKDPNDTPSGFLFQLPTCRLPGIFLNFYAEKHLTPLQQVGGTLFQVARNGFEVPGTIFEAMFSLPPGPANENGTPVEGMSLDNPIILNGIAEGHFRAFLRVLYPLWISINYLHNILISPCSAGQPPVTTFEDWLNVFHLATMWEFKLVSVPEIWRKTPFRYPYTSNHFVLDPRNGHKGPFEDGD